MYRRQLTPIFVLVLMVAAVELILSCGGNSNSTCGTYQNGSFVEGPCATPVPPIGFHITQINICLGPPLIPTRSPHPSVTPTGKATPTLTPTPCPTSTTVTVPNTLQFNASGTLKKGAKVRFADETFTSQWFSDNTDVTYNSGGQFTSVNPGCSCVYASAGGVVSGPMGISIAPAEGTQPECPPCATETPTATPSATPKSALLIASPAPSPLPIGVQQWQFDAAAPIAGPIAIGTDGRSALITSGRRLVVLDSNGNETFARPAGGDSAQISSGGTVYAEGPSGGLFAYNPDGSARWDASLAAGPGPIAIGPDGTIFYADSNELSAVSSSGDVQWNAAIPGVTQVIAQDDTIVAATAGGITAFSSDGTVAWTFAPDGGIVGGIAANATAVYAASSDDAIHAIGLSDGSELWHATVKSPSGGVAVSTSGTVFVSADRLYAFTADGNPLWTSPPMALSSVAPAAGAETVFVVVDGNQIASFDEKGDLNWVAGSFANIVSIDLSPPGLLFVGQSSGKVSVLKIAKQ